MIHHKLLNVLLAVLLSLSFNPICAIADTVDKTTNSNSGTSELQSETFTEGDAGDLADSEERSAGTLGSEESLEAGETEGYQDESSVNNEPAAFEYIYLDTNVLALGDTQYIAFALSDSDVNVLAAEMTLRTDEGVEFAIDAANIVGNTALFKITFTETTQLGRYQIVELSWQAEGAHDLDVVMLDANDAVPYVFEVVEKDVAEVLEDMSNSDESVSVIVLTEDGAAVDNDVANALAMSDVDVAGVSALTTISSRGSSDTLVVALDPGHGGSDPGACNGDLKESEINWRIANYCKAELETYDKVKVVLTRSKSEYVSLTDRVDRAVASGADVIVSVHCNAGRGVGAEVWVPNDSSYYYELHEVGEDLGATILKQLSALGLKNRGTKTGDSGIKNPDGSAADSLSIIRNARQHGMTGIIVEHAFIDSSDVKYLNSEANLKNLGFADAKGIADYYGLTKQSARVSSSNVFYQTHIQTIGWQSSVTDGSMSGTSGLSKRLESIRISLGGAVASEYAGNVIYSVHCQSYGWMDWVSGGKPAGTTGEEKRLEAIKIMLTGDVSEHYDIYYRVHVQDYGWLGWACNGEAAGSATFAKRLEAIQIVLVEKGGEAPGVTDVPYISKLIGYKTHVQSYGWQPMVYDGDQSGTSGQSKRLEGISIKLPAAAYGGSIRYRAHVQFYGWEDEWTYDGGVSGTVGEAKRLEAIQIELTGEVSERYDVYYRVHAQSFGWLDWAKNGECAGTSSLGKRLEAIQIVLVAKGSDAPGSTSVPYVDGESANELP